MCYIVLTQLRSAMFGLLSLGLATFKSMVGDRCGRRHLQTRARKLGPPPPNTWQVGAGHTARSTGTPANRAHPAADGLVPRAHSTHSTHPHGTPVAQLPAEGRPVVMTLLLVFPLLQ